MTFPKRFQTYFGFALIVCTSLISGVVQAKDDSVVNDLEAYFEFSDYGGATIFAEQIPKESYASTLFIDARSAEQFAKESIPGAINIEWRQLVAQRLKVPKNKDVVVYCNTGSLSAQAGFAIRLAGWDNVRILQGGIDEWKRKGGINANSRAMNQGVK